MRHRLVKQISIALGKIGRFDFYFHILFIFDDFIGFLLQSFDVENYKSIKCL